MLRQFVCRTLVVAAFLLLPLIAHAEPVLIFGTPLTRQSAPLGGGLLIHSPIVGFSITTDTTFISSVDISNFTLPISTVPTTYNLIIDANITFTQPSFVLTDPFIFTATGTDAGVVFTITQTGTQNITLGGVQYTLSYALSRMSLLPGQTTTITATLTPVAVPEPASMILLASGLAGIAIRVSKRRKSVQPHS
jgi:hypothetical protein